MIVGALARRYARALLELASEKKQEDQVLQDLGGFAEAYHESADLRQFLSSKIMPAAVRRSVLDQMAARLGLGDLTKKFLAHLERKGRIVGVEDVYRSYKKLVDEKLGRVDAEVTTVAPLGMAETQGLKQHIEKITGKKVVLKQTVDPSIIGGVVTRVGHLVLDGSVRSFLEEARRNLTKETA